MRHTVLALALLAAAFEPAPAQGSDGTWSVLPYLPRRGIPSTVLFVDAPRARLLLVGGDWYSGVQAIWALPTDGSTRWAPLPSVGAPTHLGLPVASILDPARDRLVIWDGDSQTLWTVSLGSPLVWTSRPMANGPNMWASAVAFDAVHRRMLMFSGLVDRQPSTPDTWALPLDDDTATWSVLPVVGPAPPPRNDAAAIVDAAHDRMIVCGGQDFTYSAGHLFRGDVWALSLSDTMRWTPLFTADTTWALRHVGASAVLDTARNRMLVFGGFTGDYSNRGHSEVRAFALDGSNLWSVAAPPDARRGSVGWGDAAVYDSQADAVYEFAPSLDEMHTTTLRLALSPSPGWSVVESDEVRPPVRFGQAMAFDPVRNRWLSFGGRFTYYVHYDFPTTFYDDLWSLRIGDRPEWEELAPVGTPPAARQDARMLYDAGSDRMILFGGQVTTGVHGPFYFDDGVGTPHFYGDTWMLGLSDPGGWSRLPSAGSGPSPRDGHVMVLDSKRHRVLLFGGRDSLGGMSDLWALPLSGSPEWTQLTPAGDAPAPRWQAVGCYDAAADRLVIAGGVDSTRQHLDAFEVRLGADTLAWSVLATSGTPPAMGLYARPYVFDAARRRVLVFGDGMDHSSSVVAPPLSSWVLDLSEAPRWRPFSAVGTGPSASYGIAAACDSVGDRVLLAGGTNGARGDYAVNDHWLLSSGDLTAPVSLMLSSLVATSHRVTLDWTWTPTASGIVASVERSDAGGAWHDVGAARVSGTRLTFVDTGVAPSIRYGYRLRTMQDRVERVVTETWVTIPGRLELVLDSPRPNPAADHALVAFDLPRSGHAELVVFDIGGRCLERHVVDAAQPGRHAIAVGRGLAPGVYLVRLTAASQSRSTKLCIVR